MQKKIIINLFIFFLIITEKDFINRLILQFYIKGQKNALQNTSHEPVYYSLFL